MISVLYVDDESALLEVTKSFIERGGGFRVDTAISAREAIEKLKAGRYDALVADYLMPEMDGVELLKYLRPRCNGMPFILFTGNGNEDVAIEALNAGADYYIRKKGSPRTQFAELETKIRSAVSRRQTDLAFRQAERDLRNLVGHLNDVIFSVNEDGIITYISPKIADYGYSPRDLAGKDFATIVFAEDIPSVGRAFSETGQGVSSSFIFRVAGEGGRPRPVVAIFGPLVENGRISGTLGQFSDRAEKIQSDKDFRETDTPLTDAPEKNLKEDVEKSEMPCSSDLFLSSPVPMLVLDTNRNITSVNQAAGILLGEVQGKVTDSIVSECDRERFREKISELLQGRSLHDEKFSFIFADGNLGEVYLSGTIVSGNEVKPGQFLISLIDISDAVRREESLMDEVRSASGIISGARDGIFSCTTDLVITAWNPAMEDITGKKAPEACGKKVLEVLPFLSGTGSDSPLARTLAGEIIATPDTQYEFPATGKRGWERTILSPLRTDTEKIDGLIGVMQEITIRTRAVLAIRAANQIYATGAFITDSAGGVRSLETLLAGTCEAAVRDGTFCGAWIGLFDRAAQNLRPVARAGGITIPVDGFKLRGNTEGSDPITDAMRSGLPAICDFIADKEAADNGNAMSCERCRSSAAVPFRLHGEIVGLIALYSTEPGAFSTVEETVFSHLGNALSSALDTLDKKTLQRRTTWGSWERARFLAAGIDSASVPFAAVIPDGTIWAVNEALCTASGYTEDELLAFPVSNLLSLPVDEKKEFAGILNGETPARTEAKVRRKDGQTFPADLFFEKISEDTGGQPCIGIFIFDVTERKTLFESAAKGEEKFRAFFEKSGAATLVAAPDGAIRAANPGACRLLGLTEKDLVNGPGLGKAGDPRFFEIVRECGISTTARNELRLTKADGTPIDVYAEASQFEDQEGNPEIILVLLEVPKARYIADANVHDQEIRESALNGLPSLVRRVNAGNSQVFFNKAWRAFTGQSGEVGEDTGWIGFMHPDDRHIYEEMLRKQEEDRRSWVTEYRLRNRSGDYRWIREISIPDPEGITYTGSDIQDIRQTENAYSTLLTKSRFIISGVAEAILVINDTISDCNDMATRLFARSRGEIIGRRMEDLAPPMQPEGESSIATIQNRFATALSGTPQEFPWTIKAKDGSERVTKVILNKTVPGENHEIVAIITDLTELAKKEHEIRRLSTYPDMNPNPVLEVRLDRTISYANPASMSVLSALGFPPDPTLFLPEDIEEIIASMKKKMPVMTVRVARLRERSFHETLCSSRDSAFLRIYAYDITERLQAMESLAYANHKLGILTSITRHDIQNKLTGVMGYLDLLRGFLRDPHLIEYLDKAEASANAIRHHIEFTRDYETLGGTAPVWQEITPLLADIRSHFDIGGIEFQEPIPGFSVFADPMFAKVLYNLVDNSVRHGVKVRHIRVSVTPADAGCILVYEDDGVGIPPEKKELIFERGFTTSSGPGKTSGLGLFLVRDILAITGITIKETGGVGTGSRFEMTIPPGKWKPGPTDKDGSDHPDH